MSNTLRRSPLRRQASRTTLSAGTSVSFPPAVMATGMVSAEPAFITFGMVRPGEPVERTVRLEAHDEFLLTSEIPWTLEGLQGQEFPFADVFQVTLEPTEEGRAADLKLRVEGFPDDLSGSFGGVVKLALGHESMPELLVRFSGVCRPGLPAPGNR